MPANKATKKSTASKQSPKAKTNTKKKAPAAARSSSTKTKASPAGEQEVKIDRRLEDDRRDEETLDTTGPVLERREKVQRRRQIDPTTCERDYSVEEVEFMNAMDEYKRKNGRMFPTCSEVLEVIRDLGYVQLSSAEIALHKANEPEANELAGVEDSTDEQDFQKSEEADELATTGWTV